MPKVNDDYYDAKKKSIIKAAIGVCSREPIYRITMKDVITEAKLSKGGIYLYYSNIDEILIDVINNYNPESDYRKQLDSIISGKASPDEKLRILFQFIGEYMQHVPLLVGKIQFELTILLTIDSERANKILLGTVQQQSGQYFNQQVISIINQGISSGLFHPALPIPDIFTFVSASIDGIVQDQVLSKCYKISPVMGEGYDPVCLMKILAESLLELLRGNISK
jgi:AcrR family transcriptional regulator